ncbi:MAG: hypothetical protein R3C53_17995 [Pirellulaceae bacterium]
MLEQLRKEYRPQLKRDPAKEFGPEFVRTTDLERRLVDEHGFDAIRLIFEDRNSANYHRLGNLPASCPWAHLNALSIASSIETVFAPIRKEIPSLIEMLRDRCIHLYAEETDTAWLLHYFLDIMLYDGRPYYHIYTGGEPNSKSQPNACLIEYEWPVPADLARLYEIHDGFGPILGSSEIAVMAKMMDPICKEQDVYPEEYRFRDLLEFHPDDAGNAQCFYRQVGGYTTVDWDHEIWEISGPQNFFEYVDERLSQIDEE